MYRVMARGVQNETGSESVETGPKSDWIGCIRSGLRVLLILHYGFSIRSGLNLEKSGLDRIRPGIYKSNFEEE